MHAPYPGPHQGKKEERGWGKLLGLCFSLKLTLSFEHILRILSSLWLTKVLVKCTHSLVITLKTPRPTGTEGACSTWLDFLSAGFWDPLSPTVENPLLRTEKSLLTPSRGSWRAAAGFWGVRRQGSGIPSLTWAPCLCKAPAGKAYLP